MLFDGLLVGFDVGFWVGFCVGFDVVVLLGVDVGLGVLLVLPELGLALLLDFFVDSLGEAEALAEGFDDCDVEVEA